MPPSSRDSGNEELRFDPGAVRADQRGYLRFPVNAPATVWRDSSTVSGQVLNVSLGGAFIRLNLALALHEAVTVTIHNPAPPLELMNDLPATVVRTTDEGCGVRFDRILLDRGVGDSLYGSPMGVR